MIGTCLAQYRITAKIGEGGMGEVYRAMDTQLGREVAIKVLPPEIADDPKRRARFLREARAASVLNHPNVCTLYEIGQAANGRPFLVMEYLQGQTLATALGNDPMGHEQIVELGIQVADALHAAHQAGVIHRDIKPSNMHLDREGRLKVFDFGLAKQTESDSNPEATTAEATELGKVMGTPSYMSPEQARGEPLDPRSDLFSVGVVLYQLATNRLPFQGSSFAETAEKILRAQPEAIARFNYDLPPELERIIRKCLEKRPEDRYQSARELLIDLRRLNRASSNQLAPLPSPHRPWRRLALAGILTAGLLLGAAWWSRQHATGPGSLRFGRSVAVLPFRTDNDGMAFFVDGLGEELANALGKTKRFDKVPPWSSSSTFNARDQAAKAIAEKLEVSTLLEGRIQKAGNQLRISATLIDPFRGRSPAVLWSDTYDHNESISVPFAIQDQIARSIAVSLQVELTGSEQRHMVDHYTKSPEAYECYRQGRLFWKKRGANLMKAERWYELALLYDSPTGTLEDSAMAPAYVGLAQVYNQEAAYGLVRKDQVAARALACVRKALAIDPEIAEAYATLGWMEFAAGHASAAEAAFTKAIEMDDRAITARYWYAAYLWATRQFARAREQALKALEIDPISDSTRTMAAWTLTGGNDPAKALEILAGVIKEHPDFTLAYYVQGFAFLKLRDPAPAVQSLQRAVQLSGAHPFIAALLAQAQASAGQTNLARATIDSLKPGTVQGIESLTSLAAAWLVLGEKERCYAVLERSVHENGCNPWLAVTDVFEEVFSETRFIQLVNRSGLLQHNPATGQFELNGASGNQALAR